MSILRERVEGLVAKWREAIPKLWDGVKGSPSHDLKRLIKERMEAFTICADELAAARDSTAPGLSAKQVEEAIMAEVSTQFLTYDHFTLHYRKIPALTERLNAVLRCVEDARSQTSGDSVRGIGTATRAIGSVEGSDATSIPETPLAASPAGRAEQEQK